MLHWLLFYVLTISSFRKDRIGSSMLMDSLYHENALKILPQDYYLQKSRTGTPQIL